MNEIFFIDKNVISYFDLISFINGERSFTGLTESEYFVLDCLKNLTNKKIKDFDDLIQNLKTTNSKILLKTSGTTGKPKEIIHTIDSITKNISIKKELSESVWGMTYAYGKMAFYQVLFQSLLNKSKLINLFGYNFDEIKMKIISNNITHISATPTFYRMLIGDDTEFSNVFQVTLGGEQSDENLLELLKKVFPNASIRNIYASSETASLFASKGNVFRIPEKYKSKINFIENVLHIHRDLIGNINELESDEEWYNTKDVVELINENEFKIIGRQNVEINISGYKVNPFKVESVINSLSYVKTVKVYPKKNSVTGSILCCDIVLKSETTKTRIKEDLKDHLEKYEIPIIINFVDFLQINESTKISRL